MNGNGALMDSDNQRRCDNPDCREVVSWREGRGRPPRNCSDRCRQRMITRRRRLLTQAQELRRLLDSSPTFRRERQLKSDLSRTEWLLSAFPGDNAGDQSPPP